MATATVLPFQVLQSSEQNDRDIQCTLLKKNPRKHHSSWNLFFKKNQLPNHPDLGRTGSSSECVKDQYRGSGPAAPDACDGCAAPLISLGSRLRALLSGCAFYAPPLPLASVIFLQCFWEAFSFIFLPGGEQKPQGLLSKGNLQGGGAGITGPRDCSQVISPGEAPSCWEALEQEPTELSQHFQ